MPYLAASTWVEVAAQQDPVLVIPVGSCEQHGPHLPFDTDTVIGEALVASIANLRPNVFVGPTITISASGEHAGFPGTLSFGTEATAEALIELVRSADWALGVMFVNAHGGNSDALTEVVIAASMEGHNVLVWSPSAPDDERSDSHAGWLETSLMLHLDASRVRLDRLEAGETRPLHDIMDELVENGVQSVSPNGVLGDPAGATAEHGRAVLQRWTGDLVDRVETWLERLAHLDRRDD